ncbi:spore coat protein U domain-containing protein [Novosphingobium taihuense]|nr:spore coat protein U domain-containing protein [Novosphingobium taihuense]
MASVRRLSGLLAAAFVALLVSVPAHAACNGALTAGTPPSVSYDPFSGEATVTATVTTNRTGSCAPGLNITGSGTSPNRVVTSSGSTLAYTINNPGGSIYQNSSTAFLGITSANNQSVQQTLTFKIAASQVVNAGTYTDTITIRFVDNGTLMSAQSGQVTTLTMLVTVTVPSKSQVNIAGSSGTFGTFAITTLDFGELAQNAVRNAFVQVRSTAAVSITVTSVNSGSLKRIGTTFQSTVAYSLSLNSTALNLSTGPKSINVNPARTIDGTNLPLAITLTGATTGLPAGTYQDVLTVDVVP